MFIHPFSFFCRLRVKLLQLKLLKTEPKGEAVVTNVKKCPPCIPDVSIQKDHWGLRDLHSHHMGWL